MNDKFGHLLAQAVISAVISTNHIITIYSTLISAVIFKSILSLLSIGRVTHQTHLLNACDIKEVFIGNPTSTFSQYKMATELLL